MDTSTGKPLGGAFVIAQWVHRGSDVVGSRTGCPRVVIVQTDASGRYHIPEADLPSLSSVDRAVFTYYPKYQRDYSVPFDEKVIALKPFTGTSSERFQSFRSYDSLRSCGKSEQVPSTLKPLYQAIDEELRAMGEADAGTSRPRSFMSRLRELEEILAEKRRFEEEKARGAK